MSRHTLPYGWTTDDHGVPIIDPKWLRLIALFRDHRRAMPYGRDDEEQHTLSLVAQLRAGGMSVRAIVAHLEAHGVGRTK